MKCHRCDKEATFKSQTPFCDEHWAEWWVKDEPDPIKREQQKQEVLKMLKEENEVD